MDDTNANGLNQVLELLSAALTGNNWPPEPECMPGQASRGRWIETARLSEAETEANEASGQWVIGGLGLAASAEESDDELSFAAVGSGDDAPTLPGAKKAPQQRPRTRGRCA